MYHGYETVPTASVPSALSAHIFLNFLLMSLAFLIDFALSAPEAWKVLIISADFKMRHAMPAFFSTTDSWCRILSHSHRASTLNSYGLDSWAPLSHKASGDCLDVYTLMPWLSLCNVSKAEIFIKKPSQARLCDLFARRSIRRIPNTGGRWWRSFYSLSKDFTPNGKTSIICFQCSIITPYVLNMRRMSEISRGTPDDPVQIDCFAPLQAWLQVIPRHCQGHLL